LKNFFEVVAVTLVYTLRYDPPLNDRSMNGAPVNVSINLSYIGDFDEKAMTFNVRFLLTLQWCDGRRQFENLDFRDNFNYLNVKDVVNQIWTPRLSSAML